MGLFVHSPLAAEPVGLGETRCHSSGCSRPKACASMTKFVAGSDQPLKAAQGSERITIVGLEPSLDESIQETRMTSTLTLRLKPGQDLKRELQRLCEDRHLKAACILTCVGSLTQMNLRLANQHDSAAFEGPLEIVSLVGTLSNNGCHLHLSASDSQGRTTGGHLVEGCLIYTTAEISIGIFGQSEFRREMDSTTGSKELKVIPDVGQTRE
jgi:uncharacterized protein